MSFQFVYDLALSYSRWQIEFDARPIIQIYMLIYLNFLRVRSWKGGRFTPSDPESCQE